MSEMQHQSFFLSNVRRQFRLFFRLPFVICFVHFSVVPIPSSLRYDNRRTYKLKAFSFHFHSFIAFKCFCIQERALRIIIFTANGGVYGYKIISLRELPYIVVVVVVAVNGGGDDDTFVFFTFAFLTLAIAILSSLELRFRHRCVGRHRSRQRIHCIRIKRISTLMTNARCTWLTPHCIAVCCCAAHTAHTPLGT